MRTALILLAMYMIGVLASGQTNKLPEEKESFVKELTKQWRNTKQQSLSDLSDQFEQQIADGIISDDLLRKIIKNTAQLQSIQGKAHPHISKLVKTYVQINESETNFVAINDWNGFFSTMLQSASPTELNNIMQFLDFSPSFVTKKQLYQSSEKTWQLTEGRCSFSLQSGVPVVHVSDAIIQCATKADTIEIAKTSGTYYIYDHLWEGEKGIVNWSKVGFPEKEVYCTLKQYQVHTKESGYQADSVMFYYENYFEHPVKGILYDNVQNRVDVNTKFPAFKAYNDNVPPQIIADNVVFLGGFAMRGAQIESLTEGKSSKLNIYDPESGTLIFQGLAKHVFINRFEGISASDAQIYIYLGEDSIMHPSVTYKYDIQNSELRLFKGDNSLASTKYRNTYHDISFDADVITWNTNTKDIYINTMSISGNKAAIYESKNYFNKREFLSFQGSMSVDPLSVIKKYSEDNHTNQIQSYYIAKKISSNLTERQIRSLLYGLVREGFIEYNEESGVITVLDKLSHYVKANAQIKDFDNIRIKSVTTEENGKIHIETKDLEINGVSHVPISIHDYTICYPDSQKITVKENLDIEFDGLFYCGRADVIGKKHYFQYDSFSIVLNQADTIFLNIPDGEKTDANGNPILMPVLSSIEEVQGRIDINIPINKSGRADLAQFPILYSTTPSKVFFDGVNIRNGSYQRDNFYYEVQPFVLDSLNYLDASNLHFEGTLYSGNILPDIASSLTLQPDGALGFEVSSPPEGFDIYQGKGKFISDITLNGDGLSGKGMVSYMSISFESSDIQFYPDSLIAVTDTFGAEKMEGEYESPWLQGFQNDVIWYPYKDTLLATSMQENPFRMYDEKLNLVGKLIVTDKKMSGSGIADWKDARLTSNNFTFKPEEIEADTANLEVLSIDGNQVAFNTPNVSAYVDIIENTGSFTSNTTDNRTEFTYNQFYTTIDEFFWDIDNKKMKFAMPEHSEGAPFTSFHPDQDSLSFLVKNADYDLEKSVIYAQGVKEIYIADSRLIPQNGEVHIMPKAQIETLENARIEATAETKQHIVEQVTANILGRNEIQANGNYVYTADGLEDQRINMHTIYVVEEDAKKKKDKTKNHLLYGTGSVMQEDSFHLYSNVDYYGNVEMQSSEKNLQIDGFAKITFNSPHVETNWFQLSSEVNTDSLMIDVSTAKDAQGVPVRTGIYVSKTRINPIYSQILNNEIGQEDIPVFEVQGNVSYDEQQQTYTFWEETNQAKKSKKAPRKQLVFNDKTNKIEAEGKLDLGVDFGLIKESAAGKIHADLDEGTYTMNVGISLPIHLNEEIINRLGHYLFEDYFDAKDIDYREVNNQLIELADEKTHEKLFSEIAITGIFERPKGLDDQILFTDVQLEYNTDKRAYQSTGKMGLSLFGERGIHKKVEGWIELGQQYDHDYFNIYISTPYNGWIFFSYTEGLLEVVSSYDDVNDMILGLNESKRKVQGAHKNEFYVYTLGSPLKARGFQERMKDQEHK